MKTNLPKISLLAVILAGQFVLQSGCASTRTQESSGEFIDDSAITAKVKAALIGDDTVKSHEITVETFKGIVQLSGFVDTSDQRSRASTVAAGVAGVKSVQNNLEIK
jgi:osmotically-inducible protein OsmY